MACCTWGQSDGEGSGLSWFFSSCPCANPGAAGGGREQQSHVPSLAPVPLRVTATAFGVPWVTEGHTYLKAALCKGKGVGDSCLKRENASFLPPQPPDFVPLSHSWCARPLCPRLERSRTPSGCGQDPLWGGLCFLWDGSFSLQRARQREVEVPHRVLSSAWTWRKVTLPLGDVCFPFLSRPSKVFLLRRSCYSPDSALSLFRKGAEGFLSPGPTSPFPSPHHYLTPRFSAGSLGWGSPVSQ